MHIACAVDRLVEDQLDAFRRARSELAARLHEQETDLHQLRVLVDDLADVMTVGSVAPISWLAQLDSLKARAQSVHSAVRDGSAALARLDRLLAALGSESGADVAAGPLESLISGRALERQEAERSRLAREVHDGPAQVLANALMSLESCERVARERPDALGEELRRLRTTFRDGLEEVRRFIFDLRPSSLEHLGLRATLERYAAEFQLRAGAPVSVWCDDFEDTLRPDQRFAVFRIVQEALQNARKHSDAAALEIRLRRRGGVLDVTVRDDGVGFDAVRVRARHGHAGLLGMRERAALAGATLSIDSAPGEGTEVRLRLPLDAPRRSRARPVRMRRRPG